MIPKPAKRRTRRNDNKGRPFLPYYNTGIQIVNLINQAMEKTDKKTLKSVAEQIGYNPQNIWHVYNQYRKMPAEFIANLCDFLEMNLDVQAVMKIWRDQPKPIAKPPKIKETPPQSAQPLSCSHPQNQDSAPPTPFA